MYQRYGKRILDILISILVLILCLPIILFVMLLIPIDSRGPLFFRQIRVGRGLSRIEIFKFRTMTNESREIGTQPIIGRAPGVTRLGFWLRRYKLDEIPQLVSVISGDLSLVGPRPGVEKHLQQMTEKEKKRYRALPGLTGLAQVSGNIHLSWKERYVKDLEYIQHISFHNDMKILLRTMTLLIKGEEYFKNKPLKLS